MGCGGDAGALGQGCCPRLQELKVGRLVAQDFRALVDSLEARSGLAASKCLPLQHLAFRSVQNHGHPSSVPELLRRLLPALTSLKTLELPLDYRSLPALIEYLTSGRPALISLSMRGTTTSGRPCDLSRLFEALAQGKVPALKMLEMDGIPWSTSGEDAVEARVQAFIRWAASE